MRVVCGKCNRTVEYAGECPSFCGYCGQALPDTRVSESSGSDQGAVTQAMAATGEMAPAPQTVGDFRLGPVLGAGGMGAVYEAEEKATGRRVAVKVIKAEYAGSADAVGRFRQGGRIASMV